MTGRLLRVVSLMLALAAAPLSAQVGKSQGVVDVNSVSEAALAKLPHMSPAVTKALMAKRPFASPLELNAFLLAEGLTQAQANEFYGRAFVHINLNTASGEEIMLIPGAGKRMAHEFDEYRPWRSYAQFDKEIGKYVSADQVARLAQYTFIPMNANTATDEQLSTIPGANAALLGKIKAARPFKAVADLEAALAKGATPAEGKRIARYFVVQ
jgi:DNA uptake protein ComE-like DNA-binding protein